MADQLYKDLPADSALGDVRALIPDIEQLGDPLDPTAEDSYIFDDDTLNRYLRINSGSVKRAAADACEALGTSEMLILKKLITEDLSTDGATLAREYGAKAQRLRARATQEEDDEAGDGTGFFRIGYSRRPVPFDAERIARGGFFF